MTEEFPNVAVLPCVSSIPDDVLIDAARMFYPEAIGVDTYSICAAALRRLRDMDEVEGIPDSAELAKWRASDPVCIAYFAMLFVYPVLASDKEHHPWFDRLLKLRKERQQRFEKGGCRA